MSYVQSVKLQYCPIQNCLKFFSVRTRKNAKNRLLPLKRSFLEICSKKKISGLDECRSLSGGVPKNLTLHWMKKICFSFYHHKRQIRSFPTMYNTWGCFLVQFGWKKCFIQKRTLQWGVFFDTVLDHLTSEAAGTHNFKDIANFHRCFKKSGT